MLRKNDLQKAARLRSLITKSWLVRLLLLMSIPVAGAGTQPVSAQTTTLQGTVSVSSTSGPGQILPGTTLNLTSSGSSQKTHSTVTNDQGEFKFTDLAAGTYILKVSLSGFKPHSESVTIGSGVVTVSNISLELLEVSGTVNVAVDDDKSISTDPAPAASFKQDNFQTLPLATERFLDALPLVPSVVRGPDGLLNVKGARASQSGLTVNSTNVTDPVTGEFAINLPIEAIQSVEV